MDWEALLAAEGMPAELVGGCPLFADPQRAMAVIPDQPGSVLPFSSGSNYQELTRLEGLASWLPAYDRHLLNQMGSGHTHHDIGKDLGISQPSTTRQLQRAVSRLQGLAAIDDLPDSPASFVDLLMVHSLGNADKRLWTALSALPSTWQVQAIARHYGLPGTSLRETMYRLDGKADPAAKFVRLVRRLPSFRRPGHHLHKAGESMPVLPRKEQVQLAFW